MSVRSAGLEKFMKLCNVNTIVDGRGGGGNVFLNGERGIFDDVTTFR